MNSGTAADQTCHHVTLKRKIVGASAYYQCECGQKFLAEKWDGKMEAFDPKTGETV